MKRSVYFVAVVLALVAAVPAFAEHVGGTVPETIPHPSITASKANGFYILVKKSTPEGDPNYWTAPYLYSTPYSSNTGWIPGDRVGYACAYMFLQQNGVIVGRVTFQRLLAAESYVQIVDKFMDESERFWDGSPTPDPNATGYNDCPPPSQSYETASVPDERPKVVYWSGGQALEIRDYTTTVTGIPDVTFDLVEVIHEPFQVTAPTTGTQTVNSRVTVLAREAGVPVAVVYYDGIGTGQVSEELFPEEC